MPNIEPDMPLHVAVGVIIDPEEHILIALRDKHAHQGGLWEFPGGKVEANETVQQALVRELQEELGIKVNAMSPLIKIKHHYTDLSVLLDVWMVDHYQGKPKGCEGQIIKQVKRQQLADFRFPEANQAIINAIQLPTEYAILSDAEPSTLRIHLIQLLNKGIKLIQARFKTLSEVAIIDFFQWAKPLCQQYQADLLINSRVSIADQLDTDGIHLTANDCLALDHRPPHYRWVIASCHNQQELLQAEKIAVDAAVLAPVCQTQTHPESLPLGWQQFQQQVELVNLPVYALGGMQRAFLSKARRHGGQGIAGISTFLEQE